MTEFETYKLFLALNNHFFQQNYDFFAYHGKVPAKLDTYEAKRQDERHRYHRLSKKFQSHEDLENFMVANLLESKKRMWVGLLFGGEADDVYVRWQGRVQAAQYNLIGEVKRLLEEKDTPPWEEQLPPPSFNGLFKFQTGEHPEILKANMRGDLSLESFVLIDMALDFVPALDAKLQDDRNWRIVKHKAVKYRPFLERLDINVSNLRTALRKAIEDMGLAS